MAQNKPYAIKAAVGTPSDAFWAFNNQKTMYGGKHIAAGDEVFVFASEIQGGAGLLACGVVASAEPTPRRPGVQRQTPCVCIKVLRTGTAQRRLGRAELKPFDQWDDALAQTELNFKLYRQATNKIVGLSDAAATFLRSLF